MSVLVELKGLVPLNSISSFILLLLILVLLYVIISAIHNIWIHPLRSFPGPKLWAATHIPRFYHENRGTLDWSILSLHNKYGPVIRIAPNGLSFNNSAAWRDIYGYGKNNLERDPAFIDSASKEPGILDADSTNHARMRRQLSHAFSEKALREQEHLIAKYVHILITQLKETAASEVPINIGRRFQYTTTDITSELAFGTSFNTLTDTKFHNLVMLQDKMPYQIILERIKKVYPIIQPFLWLFTDPGALNTIFMNMEYVRRTVMQRLSLGLLEEKKDFISYIQNYKDDAGAMTDGEIVATCRSLIFAGADTTRTLLTGVTFWLLQNPVAMKRVVSEVRTAFEKEEEITFVTASTRLPYMLACLEEGLRIHPPVLATAFSRITPPGPPIKIGGFTVPGETSVVVHPLSANYSPRNFYDPRAFHPERWLPSASDPDSPFKVDDRGAFQPFAVGPRNCIGRNLAYSQMRLILARMLWNFDLELCDESREWHHQRHWFIWEDKPLICRIKVRQ